MLHLKRNATQKKKDLKGKMLEKKRRGVELTVIPHDWEKSPVKKVRKEVKL